MQVAWGVLTHNLWVLAEKLREQRKIREQQKLEAATNQRDHHRTLILANERFNPTTNTHPVEH
ncbi:MAG: hypothetical protein JO331_15635 [Verrucomicrobia bacterium]|nr:hypothetical protein [Verrucomicrobiota bacterium]